MSILIKGMEMPKSCSVCRLFGEYGCPFIGAVGYALTRGERNEDCPLVEVPAHGRMVDAGAFSEELAGMPADLRTIALAYGVSMVKYGVNIAEKWETVTKQWVALDAAYQHGREDERKRWANKEE